MLTSPTLRSQVDALWNKFWSGGVSNPLDSIEQMSFLIFLKRLEDMEYQRMTSAKRMDKTYVSLTLPEFGAMSIAILKILNFTIHNDKNLIVTHYQVFV